ncbi:MAG: EamA family transporter [Bryobacterales bacterium]|nr:EamA family transporter [Bryobacterales bacterium]
MIFLWSSNFVVAKYALREIPPLLLGALRFTAAGLVILPWFVWKRMQSSEPLKLKGELLKLILLGICGVGANQTTFLLGLERTSVAHAALILALTPMLVLFLSSWVGHERLTRNKIVGLCIAISGIAALQLRSFLTGHASPLGDFFIFLASATFALFTVGGKSVRQHFDGLTINTFAYVGSGIALSPITMWAAWEFPLASVSATSWLSVLYMAVFPSVVSYMIYYHALHYMAPSRVASLGYLQPILATMFAVPLLGEKITWPLVSGGCLVLLGVFWAERRA